MISNESKDFSVITATFNAANTINNLVESLRKQTDQNFKWIVVDGMSTDNTLEIIRKQNHQFNKLIIINENDFGILFISTPVFFNSSLIGPFLAKDINPNRSISSPSKS